MSSCKKHESDNFIFEVVEVVNGDKLQKTTREQYYTDQYLDNWKMCYNLIKKVVGQQGIWDITELTRQKLSRSSKDKWANKTLKERQVWSRKISEALLGRKLSKKHIEKIRQAKFGRRLSESHKQNIVKGMSSAKVKEKIRNAHINTTLTDDHKAKNSLKLKGENNPFFGKTHSKNALERIRQANLGRVSPRRRKVQLLNKTTNEILCFQSITEAARYLDSSIGMLIRVLQGKRTHHKGWTMKYI